MTQAIISGVKICGIGTCVPQRRFDNITDTREFTPEEVKKVTGMAGVSERRVSGESITSVDLCVAAGREIMRKLAWEPNSVDALVLITQTPDYFLPQASALAHQRLSLGDHCAAFDVGLGCSGYPYGLWLAASIMKAGGVRRVLLLHGDTPSRYSDQSDRSVALLFGDAGSATALETSSSLVSSEWHYVMHTDGSGYADMIIEGGGFRNRFPSDPRQYYVRMQGANVFNFTLKRVPPLIHDTLALAGMGPSGIDYFILHQSNQFIMKHLAKKVGVADEKMPIILKYFGNTGGGSIPLAITQSGLKRPADRSLRLMLVGYGVGLSWASALVHLHSDAALRHTELNTDGEA